VAEDLAGASGSKLVVLVTDGAETCDGDPLAEITRLRSEGIDVRINVVGFAVDDAITNEMFEGWAEAGGGQHFSAEDADDLRKAIEEAASLPYAVLDEAGNEVARGVVGGGTIELPPGNYHIVIGSNEPMLVTIRSAETETVLLEVP
jgi:hypothetical protein